MIKRILTLAVLCTFLLTSCYTITHQVGNGAQGTATKEARQWFILWGLVPLNNVDSKVMAGGATDYTITTTQTGLDVIIGIFTSAITVAPMTVKVQK